MYVTDALASVNDFYMAQILDESHVDLLEDLKDRYEAYEENE